MGILSRYTLRLVAAPAVLAAAVIGFFVAVGAVRTQMRAVMELVPPGVIKMFDITRISFFALPTLTGYIIPVTFLLGIMMAFSRLAQNSELTAMKAAGIPLKRVVLPVAAAGLLLSGVVYFSMDYGRPWAYWRMMRLVTSELPLRVTLDMLPTGRIQEYGDWRVYIGRRDADGTLHDIMVLQPQENGEANAFYAESARVVSENGRAALEMRKGYLVPADPSRHITFETLRQSAPEMKPAEIPHVNDGMTMGQLLGEERRLARLYEETGALPVAADLRGVRVEIKNRLAFPLMCFAVGLVGAPVGARTRRSGRSHAYAAGLFLLCGYFVLRKVVDPPLLLPLSATIALGQIPNLVLGALGGWLIWRVDRV